MPQEKPKDGKLAVGSDNLLFRWEFLEALVRIAIAKYGKGAAPVPPAEALDTLVAHNLEPHVPAAARVELNHFRRTRLYCEAMDDLLKKHEAVLRALYSRWRLRPPSGGLRTKVRSPNHSQSACSGGADYVSMGQCMAWKPHRDGLHCAGVTSARPCVVFGGRGGWGCGRTMCGIHNTQPAVTGCRVRGRF